MKSDSAHVHGTPESTVDAAAGAGPPATASGVERAIENALAQAFKKFEADSVDSAFYQYFSPRRLGATAPHSCMIWGVDYRADESSAERADATRSDEIRQLGDADLVTQLDSLLNAGLRVPPDTR